MLGVVGSKLKMVKFSMQIHLWMLHDVVVVKFGQVRATMLRVGMRTSSIFAMS